MISAAYFRLSVFCLVFGVFCGSTVLSETGGGARQDRGEAFEYRLSQSQSEELFQYYTCNLASPFLFCDARTSRDIVQCTILVGLPCGAFRCIWTTDNQIITLYFKSRTKIFQAITYFRKHKFWDSIWAYCLLSVLFFPRRSLQPFQISSW